MEEVWEAKDTLTYELNIKKHVYCELQRAVERVSGSGPDAVKFDGVDALPDTWGVQVSLSLQVDETGEVDPGVSLIRPLTAATSFTTAIGAKVSSQSERVDKYEFYFPVDRLKKSLANTGNTDCFAPSNSSFLSDDLKIFQWLQQALLVDKFDPSNPVPSKASAAFKADVLSYETKFIVITSANATPQLKLLRISVNTASPFASAGRTRTHDLILTFGPAQLPGTPGKAPKAGGAREPNTIAANAALASEIGSSVASKLAVILPTASGIPF